MAPLLSVENLAVRLPARAGAGAVEVVRGVSFQIPPCGFHAIVGESGCGKSMTAAAIARLPPASGRGVEVTGRVEFAGTDVLALSPRQVRKKIRGKGGMALVFQDPVAALDPVLSIGFQLREAAPPGAGKRQFEADIRACLDSVGLFDTSRIMRSYPCELSGGMAQRVCLAMALLQKPSLIVADEPTTALDVLSQRSVLSLLGETAKSRGAAVLLITHNLALVSEYAQTASVMYAGQIVECGTVRDVLSRPRHPYVRALVAAVPRLSGTDVGDLATIPGRVPTPDKWPGDACAFAGRCQCADRSCAANGAPRMVSCGGDHAVRCHKAESA